MNFRGKYENFACSVCNEELESQKHIIEECEKLRRMTINKNVEYEKLFGENVRQQLEITKCFIENMKLKSKFENL